MLLDRCCGSHKGNTLGIERKRGPARHPRYSRIETNRTALATVFVFDNERKARAEPPWLAQRKELQARLLLNMLT